MDIAAFGVEEWLNEWESQATYDLAQSTVSSMTLEEAIRIDGTNPDDFFRGLYQNKMNYGHIEGSPEFKNHVANLYRNVNAENVLQTNGATGANLLALYALIETGDHVVSMLPTYQQLYDIPRSFGAEVEFVYLKESENWRFPIDELKDLIRPNTKMITLNSANNPTGTLLSEEDLRQIVKLAESVGAYVLVDEVYAPFNHPNSTSIVDLYDRGISTNSLSKTFSIPGIRIGWTATSKEVADIFRKYRDYTMICSGIIDDTIAVHVLKNREKVLARNFQLIEGNLNLLKRWVESEELVSLIYPEYISTSFVKINVPVPIEDFCIDLFKKEGVLLVPGSAYQIEGYVRLGYCCPTPVLQEGLVRISRYLDQYRHD